MISRFQCPLKVLFGVVVMSVPALQAQDSVQAELAAIRQLLEKQQKQLDQLTEEISKLRLPSGAASAVTAVAPNPNEFAAPATPVAATEVSNVHVVVKGESLDSIAKLHKTTIQELQKLNKITDPKKLQIGQTLQLPPPTPH